MGCFHKKKIHMESVVNNFMGFKTLCGKKLKTRAHIVSNPSGAEQVDCEACLKIIKNYQET